MTKNKPKLLLISAISPTPQNSGGATRIKNTLSELKKYYQVDFFTFSKDQYQTQPKNIFDFFKYGIPYWFSPWFNQNLIFNLNKLFKKSHYDIIQIEFSQLLYLAKYLPKSSKKVFTAHDISFISFYRRILENHPSTFKKIFRWLLFLQIYFYEKKYLPLFDTIITVSKKDQQTLQKYLPNNKIVCLENGIDKIDFVNQKPSEMIKLGYIGSFEHTPNLNAIKYFFEKISPLLTKNKIKYQFILAGSNQNQIIKKYFPNNNILNIGPIQNLFDFYSKIDCLIVPIFAGSGSRIKILEALSYGIPVISSPVGAEGIEIKDKYLMIANNPSEYLNYLQNLPSNKQTLKDKLQPYLWTNIFASYTKRIK